LRNVKYAGNKIVYLLTESLSTMYRWSLEESEDHRACISSQWGRSAWSYGGSAGGVEEGWTETESFKMQVHVQESYILRVQYWRYMLTHESNPELRYPFTCGSCQNKFTCKSDLRKRMLTPDSNPDFKYPFSCESCQTEINSERRS